MKRVQRRLLNFFAFSLLAFAIYLNFFYKDDNPGIIRSRPVSQPSSEVNAKPEPSVKK